MKKILWGPEIWRSLHVFTIKIKEECFENEKKNIIEFIQGVCANLPCPYCSQHACAYLKKHKFQFIKSKSQLIKLIFNLHNDVNKRLKKPIFEESQLLETYEKYNYVLIMQNYFRVISKANYNEKMMLYTMNRRQFIKKSLEYIKNNTDKFD